MAMDVARTMPCENVTVITSTGKEDWERVTGTTKYFRKRRTEVFDLSFKDLYKHDKVPSGHVVVGDHLMVIDAQYDAYEYDTEFLSLIQKKDKTPTTRMHRVYMDGKPIFSNMSYMLTEKFCKECIKKRADGSARFAILKAVDPAGNTTLYIPSQKVSAKMRVQIHIELAKAKEIEKDLIASDLDKDEKRHKKKELHETMQALRDELDRLNHLPN